MAKATVQVHSKLRQLPESATEIKIKMCIYGPSGVGKTRLASDIACHFKTFFVGSEKTDSAIFSNPNVDKIRPNLTLWDVDCWPDVQEAFEYIQANQNEYQWVIVDSLSDINKYAIDSILSEPKHEETLSQREWGKVKIRIEKLVRYFRDLKTNILFICLSTNEKNDMTGEICQFPSLTGKLKEEMSPYMDVTGFMYTYFPTTDITKPERAVQFISTPKAIAKDRFDKLAYENADMESILRKLGAL